MSRCRRCGADLLPFELRFCWLCEHTARMYGILIGGRDSIDHFDPRLYPRAREGHWIENGFRPSDGKRILTFVWGG